MKTYQLKNAREYQTNVKVGRHNVHTIIGELNYRQGFKLEVFSVFNVSEFSNTHMLLIFCLHSHRAANVK